MTSILEINSICRWSNLAREIASLKLTHLTSTVYHWLFIYESFVINWEIKNELHHAYEKRHNKRSCSSSTKYRLFVDRCLFFLSLSLLDRQLNPELNAQTRDKNYGEKFFGRKEKKVQKNVPCFPRNNRSRRVSRKSKIIEDSINVVVKFLNSIKQNFKSFNFLIQRSIILRGLTDLVSSNITFSFNSICSIVNETL